MGHHSQEVFVPERCQIGGEVQLFEQIPRPAQAGVRSQRYSVLLRQIGDLRRVAE
jgi:hypothetical protein